MEDVDMMDGKSLIEIDDGVAEHATLRGTPDQLLGEEVLQRITHMTNEGLEAAKRGVRSPGDIQFGSALYGLGTSLKIFDITRCASTDQRSDISNPDYAKLVNAVAEITHTLKDEVYKSLFLGCVEDDPDVARVSLYNSKGFVGEVVKKLNELEKKKSV